MKEYKINIDPRILELLGPNLYTNIYYVLAELIANAYDADAKNVYVISSGNSIRVEDDGHGMSYDNKEIEKYLNVAGISRASENDSYSFELHRKKMGRKGIGKLAALSVSENVDVMTVTDNGEKSGFILSRTPLPGNFLEEIPEDKISFSYIKERGTAIVMNKPQYSLTDNLDVIQRNILKIFPLVEEDFQLHFISSTGKRRDIANIDVSVAKELNTIITLGKDFESLSGLVPNYYPAYESELKESRPEESISINLVNNAGEKKKYDLKIKGWIGTYKTTRGRKTNIIDFPDNYISLFANKKLGEFNILPAIGQNKLPEVYVVGQLHVDLFELTELPDMALSNRQGYKSDDERYKKVLEYVRTKLLPEILQKRKKFADLTKLANKKKEEDDLKKREDDLKKQVDNFKKDTVKAITNKMKNKVSDKDIPDIEKLISNEINKNIPNLGIKAKIDKQKKKILISQTGADKDFADIVYQMLLFNNVPSEDIIYTNCDDELARIPEGEKVYEYLRKFFVESYSTQNIYVLFVTSENTKKSWGALTEVGAAWITQIDHKIFNISPFRPEHPLDDETTWQSTDRDMYGELSMSRINADVFCVKIENVCSKLHYAQKNREENIKYLSTLVEIKA